MARMSDSAKAAVWRRRVARFGRAGVSVVRFCEDEGVSTASFYRWRKRLGEAGSGGPDGNGIGPVGFAAVRVTAGEAAGEAAMLIELPAARVEAPAGNIEAVRVVLAEVLRRSATLAGGGSGC